MRPFIGSLAFLWLWVSLTLAHSLPQQQQQQYLEQPKLATTPSSEDLSSIISASPVLSLHRALCEVESISNNELAVAKLLVSYLEAHDFRVTVQSVPQPAGSDLEGQKRWNVFAVPDVEKYGGKREDEGPKVILTSHIDTVPPFIPYSLSYPPSESSDPFNRSAIHISGRGTVDAKACVATQIHAVLSLLSTSTISPSTPALLFVVGEETNGMGMQHFSASPLNKALNYTAVIFGEPTELRLATGHKGITMLTLTAHGKAAHSGYPWLGLNANTLLLKALTAINDLGTTPVSKGGLPSSAKFGNTTVNIGLLSGGVAANVIPSHALAKISFRLAAGTAPGARTIITSAIRHAVGPDDFAHLDLEFTQGYGPVPLDAGVPGFDEMTVNYGTDVPNLARRDGVKRYLYGPGSIQVAHGKDEGLSVGDLEEAVEGYKKLVLNALGDL